MENQEKNSSKDKRNNLIVIILSVIIVILACLFFWQRSSYKTDAALIRAEKDSIASELTKMVTGYDSIRSENDSLNKTISFAQTKVKDLLLEVGQVKNCNGCHAWPILFPRRLRKCEYPFYSGDRSSRKG